MINKVTLLGNLGKDPEIHRMESGVTKASFSLATSESYKNKDGEKVTTTEWHNIVFWRGLAEVCEKYLKKGARIYLEGKITYREYEDKEGNKKRITEIIGSEMKMLDRPAEGERNLPDDGEQPSQRGYASPPSKPIPPQSPPKLGDEDDGFPF